MKKKIIYEFDEFEVSISKYSVTFYDKDDSYIGINWNVLPEVISLLLKLQKENAENE